MLIAYAVLWWTSGLLGSCDDIIEPVLIPAILITFPIAWNVCYCGGAALQSLAPPSNPDFKRRLGPFLFKVGLSFSLILLSLPAIDAGCGWFYHHAAEMSGGSGSKQSPGDRKNYGSELFQHATDAFGNGDYASASKLLRQELHYDPSDCVGHFFLAQSLRKEGLVSEALNQYDLALTLDPNYGASWFEKAELLRSLGRANEAAKAYKSSMKCGLQSDQQSDAIRFLNEFKRKPIK